MEWLTQNWFWVLIFVVFIAMHLLGHGGHGGGGGCGGGRRRRDRLGRDEDAPPSAGHQH
jgi:hypothetical protein